MDVRALGKEIEGKRAGKHAPMYIYGTEIMDYYKKLGVKNKRVLTIAGSGDQIINAYFYGAKDVVGFDLNRLVRYFVEVKFAAIQIFSYAEFLRFFGTGKKDAHFDYVLYLKIRSRLAKQTREFFDELYNYFKFNGDKMARSAFFHQRVFTQQPLTVVNVYLRSEANYLKSRKVLFGRKTPVIPGNVTRIAGLLKGKFDLINLSNVPNFLMTFYRKKEHKDPGMHFYDHVLLKLRKILNKGGRVFFYLYTSKIYPNPMAKKRPPMSTPEQQRRYRARSELKYSDFRIKGFLGGYDKVVVLKK